MRRLSGLAFALSVLAVGLMSPTMMFPVAIAQPSDLLVYEIVPPVVTKSDVEWLAANVFNMSVPIAWLDEDVYVVNGSYPQYLEVHQSSGSIWYADWSKIYNQSHVAGFLGEDQTLQIAQSFLGKYNLFPTSNGSEIHFAGFGNTTNIYDNETVRVSNYDAVFNYTIDGDDVYGPGAKTRVSFDGPEIIGVHNVWREVIPYQRYPERTEPEARQILREMFKAEYKAGFQMLEESLTYRFAYYGGEESENQEYLQPYYFYDGEIQVGNDTVSFQTHMVPATTFTPKASIVSPTHGERFLVDETIFFNATVESAEPIVSTLWEWNETLLDTTQYFETTLPCGNKVRTGNETDDKGLVPHTIQFTVTDALGNTATDYVSIVVTVLIGDVNGDSKVDIRDIARAAKAFGSYPGHLRWDFIVDLNNDDQVDIRDIAVAAKQFGDVADKPSESSLESGELRYQFSFLSVSISAFTIPAFVFPLVLVAVGSKKSHKRKKMFAALMMATVIVICTIKTPIIYASWVDGSDTTREVGLESVGGNLEAYATASSTGFKNRLASKGWTVRFHWKEWAAWEQDFKYRTATGGGKDYRYIDRVDFAYYVGHGCPRYITFLSQVDYKKFYFTRARWGGTAGGNSGEEADLEWIALESCNTLQWYDSVSGKNVFQRWRPAFQGLHYVLGFHTKARASYTLGGKFAKYMTRLWWYPYTIRKAWIRATQEVQPSDRWGAFLRAGSSGADTYNDYLPPLPSSPDPDPSTQYLHWSKWQC